MRLLHSKTYGLVFIFLALTGNSISQPARWKATCDFSWVRDSNVYESLSSPAKDDAGRIWMELSRQFRILKQSSAFLQYQGGAEGYNQHADENRMIHTLKGIGRFSITRQITCGLSLYGRSKHYFQTDDGYDYLQAAPFIQWRLSPAIKSTATVSLSRMDYSCGAVYDDTHFSGSVRTDYTPAPEIAVNIHYQTDRLSYRRRALDFKDYTFDTALWVELDEDQRDQMHRFGIGIDIFYWALIKFNMEYQAVTSNSYGYSYTCPGMRLTAAKNLPWGLILRLFWTMQWKHYSDPLEPILQIRPENEEEENSYWLVDLSKDLNKRSTFRVRFGQYKNESPFRNLYYKKTLLSLGFTCRFR